MWSMVHVRLHGANTDTLSASVAEFVISCRKKVRLREGSRIMQFGEASQGYAGTSTTVAY